MLSRTFQKFTFNYLHTETSLTQIRSIKTRYKNEKYLNIFNLLSSAFLGQETNIKKTQLFHILWFHPESPSWRGPQDNFINIVSFAVFLFLSHSEAWDNMSCFRPLSVLRGNDVYFGYMSCFFYSLWVFVFTRKQCGVSHNQFPCFVKMSWVFVDRFEFVKSPLSELVFTFNIFISLMVFL